MKKIIDWLKKNILGLEEPKRRKVKSSAKGAGRKKNVLKKKTMNKISVKKSLQVKKKLQPITINKKKFEKNADALLSASKDYLKKNERIKVPVKIVSGASTKLNTAPKLTESEGKSIGVITHFFPNVSAAILKVSKGSISIGESIHFKGSHTDFKITVKSMQMNRAPIEVAKKGQEIGIQVPEKVQEGDLVFKVVKNKKKLSVSAAAATASKSKKGAL